MERKFSIASLNSFTSFLSITFAFLLSSLGRTQLLMCTTFLKLTLGVQITVFKESVDIVLNFIRFECVYFFMVLSSYCNWK